MCPITIVQWLEGDELRLPALNGEVRLKISPGLKSEGTLKVASRGLAKADGSRGDLLIQYRLFMPKRLSKKQSLLLKRLEELPGFSPAQDEKGFFPRSA
jgi:molecular chaperone DnaJ